MNKIKKQLAFIETFGLKSQHKLNIDEFNTLDLKLVWNFTIKDRYNADLVEYSQEDIDEMMKSTKIHECYVPKLFEKLEKIYSENYFQEAYNHQNFQESFEIYLIAYTVFVLRTQYKTAVIDEKIQEQMSEEYLLEKLNIKIPKVIYATWAWDPSLQQQYPLTSKEELNEWVICFNTWILPEIKGYYNPQWFCHEFNLPFEKYIYKAQKVVTSVKEVSKDRIDYSKNKNFTKSEGVNLIGWVKTEIGIGEDVRMAFDSCSSKELPCCIIDAAKILPPSPEQVDLGYEEYIVDKGQYSTDIIYLDAATQFRYFGRTFLNNEPIDNKKIILVAPWELPSWPQELGYIFDHVDIFWAATKYIYDAFEPFFKGKEIKLAPPAVVVDEEKIDDFDVKDVTGTFVFLTTFDGLSSIHRKNPFATIKAFIKAFPITSNTDVKLIVKTMNFSHDNPELEELSELILSDKRIELINETLSKDELYQLNQRAHCFISLHRAEGFGRNIAEMMLFNRPVIVSNFSGNVDFCLEDTSYLINGKLIDIDDKYWYSTDQKWFDADINEASSAMLDIYQNREKASIISKNGQNRIKNYHSPEAVGENYKQLLLDSNVI
jgi:glycosyltransferase involved in cell wall biosynthesis